MEADMEDAPDIAGNDLNPTAATVFDPVGESEAPEAEERVYTVEEKLDILAEQFMYLDSQVTEMREAMTSMAGALVKVVRAIDAAESKVAAKSNVVLPDGTDISHLNRKQRRDLTFGRTRG